MVAGADGYTLGVEHLAQVVRVHALDRKGDRAAAVVGGKRPGDPEAVDTLHLLQGVGGELALVRLDVLHADLGEEAHRLAESHNLGGHLGARLETLRRRGVGGTLHAHDLDHRAAREERRQLVEVLRVQRAHAGRAAHLVPRESREVDVEGVEVHRHVGHRLAGVEHRERADGLCAAHHLGHVRVRAGDVGLVGKRHNLDRVVELERVEVDAAVLRHRIPLQRRSGAARQLLPRHEVGVVLELRDHDGVALAHRELACAGIAQHVRDQVQRLCGVFGERDLVVVRADEVRDGLAGGLVRVGGLLRQFVGAAVYGRVAAEHEVTLSVPHPLRALRRRPRIQVHQRFAAAHGARQDRELLADGCYVERHQMNFS